MAQQYTKNKICDVFARMLNQCPLSKITVKEVVTECGINRNPFFYYYADLYEVLTELFQSELQRVIDSYNDTLSWEESFLVAADFALKNKKAIYHVYSIQREELETYLYDAAGNVMRRYAERIADGMSVSKEEYVYISKEEDYDIAIDLEGCLNTFDELRLFIVFLAKHICELYNIVQKFNNSKRTKKKMTALSSSFGTVRFDYLQSMEDKLQSVKKDFPFDLSLIYLARTNFITLDYWCTQVNSQFDVVFEYKNEEFMLRRFGAFDCIPDDWDKK